MSMQDLLNRRRSVRHFDPSAPLAPELLSAWIAGASRSPNGNNIQAVRYLHIADPDLRARLLPAANGQKPVTEASALVAVLGDRRAFEADKIRRILEDGHALGYFDAATRDNLANAAIGYYEARTPEELNVELTRDASLAAMSLILLANEAGYQTLTMSGYDSAELRETLELPEHFADVMLIAIGKSLSEGHRTVRHPVERILFTDRIR
ncbi:NAD(P)H nitroreductase [Saccharibacillus sp. O23]|uniref:nitroreductase family protein n=1 Tax=Saccharibacillus sp. O23 TaxID=2009338 RepID=UPI000B4E6305|nr:nitroreductase family protein [Saccharibacillus sp. O23]OWR31265.1 NAD(P)H nitroreductase [Saccharibacillus sp. O23]